MGFFLMLLNTTRRPTSFFSATFPAAREAACKAAFVRSTYDPHSPVDCPTFHEATQPLDYDIRNEPYISSTSVSFRGSTQELSYPQLHIAYPERLHPPQPFLSHHQIQPSFYFPPRPVQAVRFFLTFFFEQFLTIVC
jgi:hypothetical protein